jgi:hypothetical protein
MAVHLGPVDHGGHGFVGSDVNFLFRMVDARPPWCGAAPLTSADRFGPRLAMTSGWQ